MSASIQRLESTGEALRTALSDRDWARVGELDLQCRLAVEEAMVEPQADAELLSERMTELLGLYQQLVETCRAEQQRIASELLQLNQSKQGAKVYQLFG